MRRTLLHLLLIVFAVAGCVPGCAGAADSPDYADRSNWAYWQDGLADSTADVFFVCPTVYFGTDTAYNMRLSDEAARTDFIGAINMEKGIYDEDARFFAPYYRQAGLNVYTMSPGKREQYLELAYSDVRDAFEYYLDNVNDGRPIILAGFSQGADMALRLMKDCFSDPDLLSQLIACYAVGWSITEEEMQQFPHLKFAQGEDDTGVIVSFNSEAPHVTESVVVPDGTRTLAVNPLTWETGTETADRSLNEGACFMDTDGSILSEIDRFTGAYIDEDRGTLKVTDVDEAEYPPQLDIFEDGVYHVYDYQFFYRNLQDNVRVRTAAYVEADQSLGLAA